MTYQEQAARAASLIQQHRGTWDGIDADAVARMRLQNRFLTGLDIARYTAGIMRRDMAAYDADPGAYTQSLGCWHGFIAQQKIISIKKHFGTTKGRYLYLSGWMVAALRSEFGPLPDQSMHEKTSVPALIAELYTFLKQADARELGMLFRDLDGARAEGNAVEAQRLSNAIDQDDTHVVPIIAAIDAGKFLDEIVPLNRKYGIEELLAACAAYPGASNARRITFEYVMLKDKNDSDADARELVRLIRAYDLPAKVNLIPFNPWPGADYECSTPERIARFSEIVFAGGISAPVRTPRGRDIDAACGQLKTAAEKKSRAELDRQAEEKLAALG